MKKGIIGAGNWIVDIIKTIDRFPAVGELCNILSQEVAGGGGPCNVLFDLAAMEVDIPLYAVGRIGVDGNGDYLYNEISKRKINSDFIIRDATKPTSYTDVMSGNGKRTFFSSRGANANLSYEDFVNVNIDAKIFYLGYLLLLDKLDSADPEYGTVGAKVLNLMQQKGYKTLVDFVSEAPEKFRRVVKASLSYIDYLVINEIEAGNTFEEKIRLDDDSLDFEAMERVAVKFFEAGVKELVIFHYPEGAFVMKKGEKGQTFNSAAIDSENIVGTNGAGDAFCAGVLYGLHEDLPIEQTIAIANWSAVCNLSSPSASGGARPLKLMQ